MIAVMLVLALTSGSVSTVMQPTFTTVSEGQASGIEEPREVVVQTAAEWKALWQQHTQGLKMPPVDFAKSSVVAIFLGTRNTGGHKPIVSSIDRTGSDVVVSWHEEQPGRDMMVTQALTSPFVIVRFDKASGAVKFKKGPATTAK